MQRGAMVCWLKALRLRVVRPQWALLKLPQVERWALAQEAVSVETESSRCCQGVLGVSQCDFQCLMCWRWRDPS